MRQTLQLKLLPREAILDSVVREYAAKAAGCTIEDISGYHLLKRSIDARGKQPHIILSLEVFIREPYPDREESVLHFPDVSGAKKKAVIVGGGPAGLFAALKLIEKGVRPILLERGKDVRTRRRDLAILNKEGIINPESNYCFGEGGAGTYSDGKLYTRSTKRGDIRRILKLFVQFGAQQDILYDAHPHIGTNKLPGIIQAMRQKITDCGGSFHFGKKLVDIVLQDDKIREVRTADGELFGADAVLLATGHSARDIFHLLHDKKILIEAKPFAIGVRVEHPQALIDSLQYHSADRGKDLPPAAYSLVEQVRGRGVFSFCMCPGGIIAPASTAAGELVVNGWSPSKRNNPYANSGIVVGTEEKDWAFFQQFGPLAGLYFQRQVEQAAFEQGGGLFRAPAQRMTDFVSKKTTSSLPSCSYLPGILSAPLQGSLPPFVYESLQLAFKAFGAKMKGYYTEEAVVVATESRTSSPVRIPRDPKTLQHPQIKNLYPCGEGAGYAGGIVSAAMDGELVASRLAEWVSA
jgi:uncharacterized protein